VDDGIKIPDIQGQVLVI
jgi:KH domain